MIHMPKTSILIGCLGDGNGTGWMGWEIDTLEQD